MSILSRRTVKTGLITAATTAALATALPATASADPVDRALNALPAGQITCEQAENYWTTEAEYNEIAAQARAVAVFHPRGGEINAALARVDEAADRCGLKGGGAVAPAQQEQAPAPQAPVQQQPVQTNDDAPAPAPVPVQEAPAQETAPADDEAATERQIFTVPVAPGTPTVDVPVGDVATVVIPDVLRIVADFLSQFGVTLPR
ncbi:hypothetical protein [Corynebacterium halotolerans]|nr:hypothetical protein [Corynebacterium halotolerans]